MSFHVGQKIVCVDDRFTSRSSQIVLPVRGTIYTVRGVMDFSLGPVCWLAEIHNMADHINDDTGEIMEPGFPVRRFRPLVEDRKSVSFQIGADPDSERWDNRKKRKEKV